MGGCAPSRCDPTVLQANVPSTAIGQYCVTNLMIILRFEQRTGGWTHHSALLRSASALSLKVLLSLCTCPVTFEALKNVLEVTLCRILMKLFDCMQYLVFLVFFHSWSVISLSHTHSLLFVSGSVSESAHQFPLVLVVFY